MCGYIDTEQFHNGFDDSAKTTAFRMDRELLDIFINNAEETDPPKPVRLEELQKHRDPFEFLRIADNTFLDHIEGRSACTKCHKSRKLYCYSCFVPNQNVADLLPRVKVSATFKQGEDAVAWSIIIFFC